MKNKIYQKILVPLLILALVLGFIPQVRAAEDTEQHNVTFTILTACQLNTVPNVAFGDVDPSGSPYTSSEFTVQLKSNANWSLKVKSVGPNGIGGDGDDNQFKSNNGAGPDIITVNDHLEWSKTPYATWTFMQTTDAEIATGTKNTDNNWQDVLMKYRLTIGWADQVAPNYLGKMQYTVTTL